jgi:hypothetical protein
MPLPNRLFLNTDNNWAQQQHAGRPGFQLNESPVLHELPTLPMFESSDEEYSGEDEDRDDTSSSLVSSLSNDDSLFRLAPPTTPTMSRDTVPWEHHLTSPPLEIIVSLKTKQRKQGPVIKPDWLRDDLPILPSPISSMSYSTSSDLDWAKKQTNAPFAHPIMLNHQSYEPTKRILPNIFRPAAQHDNVQPTLLYNRPEVARRAVTFPESTIIPSYQPTTFQRAKSLPQYHFFVQDELLMDSSPIQRSSRINETSVSMEWPSPDDVKLLGQRPNRYLSGKDAVCGTGGVGSDAGQISFHTDPTTSSSAGAYDITAEEFPQQLKVQSMFNTLVVEGDGAISTQNAMTRRQKGHFWKHVSSPIQRLMFKQSSQRAFAGADSHVATLKQPAEAYLS